MRPFHLTVVTAVSTAVLLATTAVYAAPSKVNLGTLKAQEAWKVGTVENNGEEYCAMVGTYGKGVVVAFARNPQGLGSLALDFGDPLFTPGQQYDVSLTAEGLSPRNFTGRASADRSLVVQIGQDGSFYDALSKNGALGVDMPAATLRIDLAKFSNSHKDLVECAGTLAPSPAKQELPLVREAKTNVDHELEELSRAKTQLADASTKAATLQKDMAKKTSSFDEIEAQLEAEARAEAKRSRETIASIEAQQKTVRAQLEQKGVKEGPLDLAVLEPAAGGDAPSLPLPSNASAKSQTGGRKLLGAIGSREPVDMPFSTGASSRDIEARELGLADAARAAAETEQALQLKNEIAALEAKKNAEAQEKLAAFDNRQQELSKQTQTLVEQRDNTLAKLSAAAASEEKSRGLRANVVAQQAKIAAVNDVKQTETAALTKTLASTQSDFESRIAALEAERQSLRDQVKAVTAENTLLRQGGEGSNASDRLEVARLKKQLLDMETQRQGELARATASQRELDDARQQLAALRQGGQAEEARLASLKQQLDAERKQLETARSQSPVATGGLETLRQSLAKKEGELTQRQSDLDKQAAVLAEESQRLHREKQQLSVAAADAPIELVPTAVKGKDLSPGQALLSQSQRLVDAERVELNDLRGRIKSLEQDLAKTRDEANIAAVAAAAAPKPAAVSTADKAELARLKEENTGLRQRLAGFLGGGNKEAPAINVTEDIKAAAPVPAPVPTASGKTAQGSPAMAALGLTADELNATEPAAGATTDLTPGNDKRMPAVPAGKVTAEVVTPPAPAKTETAAKVALASAKENIAPAPVAAAPAVTPDVVDTSSEAELELARLAPITAPVPRTTSKAAAPVSASSKDEESQDKGVFGIFGRAMGYGAAKDRAAQAPAAPALAQAPAPAAEKPAIIRVSHAQPAPAPQPVAAPVAPIAADTGGISSADANRAAAFLDNIMAFHRPDGVATPAPAVQMAAMPVPSVPVTQQKAAAPVAVPAPPAAVQMAAAPVADIAALNRIETAAGGAMAAPVSAAPVVPSAPAVPAAALTRPAYLKPSARPSPVAAAPVLAPAPAVQVPAPAPQPVSAQSIDLDALLNRAGVSGVSYTGGSDDGTSTLRQWTTGALNGLYERQLAGGGFKSQVDGYLARYRGDCPGQLDVRLGDVRKTAAGSTQLAELTCAMQGNAYATTIAFLEAGGHFHTVLHAAQIGDAQKARQIGGNVMQVMNGVQDIRVAGLPQSARVVPVAMTAPAAVSPSPSERPRFRIEIEAPAAPPEGVYDLPTTIIE